MEPQQNQDQVKHVVKLIFEPLKAQYQALRNRDRVSLIVLGIAGALSFFNLFMGMKDSVLWTSLALLGGLFLWIAYKRADALKTESISKRDLNIVYASAVILAFPVAYAELFVVSFAAAIAFIVAILAVLAFFVNFFVNSKGTSPSGGVLRGANSHINANGEAKLEYKTLNEAKAAAVKYESDFKEKMSVYTCASGGHYHIGHTKDL